MDGDLYFQFPPKDSLNLPSPFIYRHKQQSAKIVLNPPLS